MREVQGDITRWIGRAYVVIPVNIGYRMRPPPGDDCAKVGANVMGAGLAKVVAGMYPILPLLYGQFCYSKGKDTPVTWDIGTALILFPVKPLKEDEPHASWKQKASLELIERSAKELAGLSLLSKEELVEWGTGCARPTPTLETDEIYLPLVGCGNGGRKEAEVMPILQRHLSSDRFVLVRYAPSDDHPF